jgi:hypothetical protein
MTPSTEEEHKANYRYLLAQIEQVAQILDRHLSAGEKQSTPQLTLQQKIPAGSSNNTLFRLD